MYKERQRGSVTRNICNHRVFGDNDMYNVINCNSIVNFSCYLFALKNSTPFNTVTTARDAIQIMFSSYKIYVDRVPTLILRL